jgi:hypothetical protein
MGLGKYSEDCTSSEEVVQLAIFKVPRTESEIQSVADVFMRSHFQVLYKLVGNKGWKVSSSALFVEVLKSLCLDPELPLERLRDIPCLQTLSSVKKMQLPNSRTT